MTDIMDTPTPVNGMPAQVSAESSYDEIRDYGLMGGANRCTGILQEGIAAFALHEKCKGVSGGSEYTARVTEYWPWSPATASERLAIGKAVAAGRFSLQRKAEFPSSGKALLALSKLPEEKFREGIDSGAITPTMTAKQAKDLNAPKPTSKPSPKAPPQASQEPATVQSKTIIPPDDPEAVEVSIVDGEVVDEDEIPSKLRDELIEQVRAVVSAAEEYEAEAIANLGKLNGMVELVNQRLRVGSDEYYIDLYELTGSDDRFLLEFDVYPDDTLKVLEEMTR